jgi:hypothetical protein
VNVWRHGDNALCSSVDLILSESPAKFADNFTMKGRTRGRGFKSAPLHHPVSLISDIAENRSKSGRERAICAHAWTQRISASAKIARIWRTLSGRDLPRSADHRVRFAPPIIAIDSPPAKAADESGAKWTQVEERHVQQSAELVRRHQNETQALVRKQAVDKERAQRPNFAHQQDLRRQHSQQMQSFERQHAQQMRAFEPARGGGAAGTWRSTARRRRCDGHH